mmetsp:Transcript_16734/g.29752  ORF Transcript_16734/g.29752 Transcript_16734/m.29752 type:complete len:288 (-) Transcript_16734:62-925(-)
MTELQKTLASVERLEGLVLDLVDSVTSVWQDETVLVCFSFEPPLRKEPQALDHDWVVLDPLETKMTEEETEEAPCGRTQREREISRDFLQAQRWIRDLSPTIARMRTKCLARIELNEMKERLRGLKSVSLQEQDVLQAAVSELYTNGGQGTEDLQLLRQQALELERSATYGSKTVEQVLDLVVRFDAAQALFDTDVVPALDTSAAAAEEVREVEQRAASRMEAEFAAEQQLRDARRPAAELLAESERRLHSKRQAAEASQLLQEHSKPWAAEVPRACAESTGRSCFS